ncbi:MAG: hypothetical protein U5P41_05705 [Gammaproteobacteria bacterium]|nr:hypothetical protein [Gammaproteobacteria bacterium]
MLLGYCFRDRILLIAVVGISWFWFLGATFLSLSTGYTRDLLGGNEHVATLLLARSRSASAPARCCASASRTDAIELRLVIAGCSASRCSPWTCSCRATPAPGRGP